MTPVFPSTPSASQLGKDYCPSPIHLESSVSPPARLRTNKQQNENALSSKKQAICYMTAPAHHCLTRLSWEPSTNPSYKTPRGVQACLPHPHLTASSCHCCVRGLGKAGRDPGLQNHSMPERASAVLVTPSQPGPGEENCHLQFAERNVGEVGTVAVRGCSQWPGYPQHLEQTRRN